MNFPTDWYIKASAALARRLRSALGALLVLLLAACASNGAQQEAELAAQQEQARIVAEQEAAIVAEREQRRAAEMERQRERQRQIRIDERARLAAERAEREKAALAAAEEAEKMRIAAEEEARVAAQRAQQQAQRREAQLALEAARESKLARIEELEALISRTQTSTNSDEQSVTDLIEAVAVAEELLNTLTLEQSKYEETDDQGNTLVPLAKEAIAELEAQRNELVGRIRSQ